MKPAWSTSVAETLRREVAPQRFMTSLITGSIGGLLEVVVAISLAGLIFSDRLEIHLNIGISLALLGALVANVLITLLATIPGTVSGTQEAPAAITAVIAAAVVTIISQTGSAAQLLPTVLVAIALTTLLCGLFFYMLGRFQLGNIIRFLPYPVVGGFLAGTGWLLLIGAIDLMAGAQLHGIALLQPDVLMLWLPGLLLGALLFVVSERWDSSVAFPLILLLATLLFALFAWLSGATLAELRAQGWLLKSLQTNSTGQSFTPALLTQVDWGAIVVQIPRMLTLILVSTIALLLNVSSLEIMAREEVDFNAELRLTGFANLLSGLTGGLVQFHDLSVSTLNQRRSPGSRMPGLVKSAALLIALLAGSSVVTLLPKPIMGSVLVLLGLAFLYDWLIRTWFALSKVDYLIVVVILLVIVGVGFLEGIGVGLLFAVIMFVVDYSRTEIVRHELTGKTYHSRVTRPPAERALLYEVGDRLRILELQGFIFFGTADKLLNRIRRHIYVDPSGMPTFVLLDFRRATGLDATAMLSFQKLRQFIEETAVTVVLTALPPTIKQQFAAAGLIHRDSDFQVLPDLDRGVEWCENRLLQTAGFRPPLLRPLRAQLADRLQDATGLNALLRHAERLEMPAGAVLIAQGAPADELYFIESGRVTARLEQPGQPPLRLETMGYGHVVGELGFYLGETRTATVVAVEDSVVYRLTRAGLVQMELDAPQAAATLHRLIVQLLAERVTHLVAAVDALSE